MKSKKQKGQVLVEALVALGAAVVIIGVIATVVVTSLNNSELAKNQNLATQYSRQGMEIVRELTETNWPSFSLKSGWYCLYNDSTILEDDRGSIPASEANSCKWTTGIFNRRINIQHNSMECSNNSKITVAVGWSDSKCTDSENLYCHKVQIDSCFANIKAIPAL